MKMRKKRSANWVRMKPGIEKAKACIQQAKEESIESIDWLIIFMSVIAAVGVLALVIESILVNGVI